MKKLSLKSLALSLLASLPAALLLTACEDDAPAMGNETPPMVVEGWIDEHEAPMVMVTRAVNLREDTPSFDNFVEKWCRVSIFDNGRQYLLHGHIDNNYIPQFVFTSSRLKGEVGHTYRLMVETETDTLIAESELRSGARIESLEAVRSEGNDTLFSVRAKLSGVSPEGHYRMYARSQQKDTHYYGSFLGTFFGADYDPEQGIIVTRGIRSAATDDHFTHYFASGDVAFVKLCTIDRTSYDFWKTYDSCVSLSSNLFFTYLENCPSNVAGALGCFTASGTSVSFIRLP